MVAKKFSPPVTGVVQYYRRRIRPPIIGATAGQGGEGQALVLVKTV
jgi:hypothetical protein